MLTVTVKAVKMSLSVKRLIELARLEEGSYKKVAEKMEISNTRISEWKNGKFRPEAKTILQLAEIAGLNPAETLFEVMQELDKENAHLWKKWRPYGDSNPGYRRERAVS